MESAFGVDHGDIEKGVGNFARGLFGAGKKAAAGGKRMGESSPMYDQMASKMGIRSGGKHRAPGSHKGSLRPKSFSPFGGGGGKRRAT